jgi:hypothetical protein
MDNHCGNGKSYYKEMCLEKFNFTIEEEKAICDFYDFSITEEYENLELDIEPISKKEYDSMANYLNELIPDVCLLWKDGQSNYAGVYYKGDLRGKIMFLSHDEPNYSPLFRSITSFLASVKNGTISDLYVPQYGVCDYPAKTLSDAEREENYALAQKYLNSLQGVDDELGIQIAMKAWYLMPVEHLDLLIPLMKSGNMYIEQDIPCIFSFHNYKNAIPALQEVADKVSVHIKGSAKRALSEMAITGR